MLSQPQYILFAIFSRPCILLFIPFTVFPSKITYIAAEGKNESAVNNTSFDVSGVSTFHISYSVDNETFEDYIYDEGRYVSS